MMKTMEKRDVYKRQVSESGTVFHYENRRQKNAVYTVYDGADIVTEYGTKVYSKGDLVKENLTTGENGSVTLKNLHLGTYVVCLLYTSRCV